MDYLCEDLHAFQRAYPVFSRDKQKEVYIALRRQFCYLPSSVLLKHDFKAALFTLMRITKFSPCSSNRATILCDES
jgi:hypothetical protein